MDQEEVTLIRKAQHGDCMAFESLVRKYDKHVLSLALNMVGNVEDAKDIYQEVFIRAFRSLSKFRFQSEFFTWLYRITVNYSINFRKQRSHRAAFFVDSQQTDAEKLQIIYSGADQAVLFMTWRERISAKMLIAPLSASQPISGQCLCCGISMTTNLPKSQIS